MIKKGDWVYACVGRKTTKFKVAEVLHDDEYVTLELPGYNMVAFISIDDVLKVKPPIRAVLRRWFQCGFDRK